MNVILDLCIVPNRARAGTAAGAVGSVAPGPVATPDYSKKRSESVGQTFGTEGLKINDLPLCLARSSAGSANRG
jgi:hypothetical protein